MAKWNHSPDRYFSPEPTQRALARQLYSCVKDLPLVCPHGHVSPALLGDPNARLASPAELFIIPDHYVTRMLYSQGISLAELGVPSRDGSPVETDHRKIWERFAENFHLFNGTPTGLWIKDELISVFGVSEKLNGESAQRVYDHLEAQLAEPAYSPRALFERFNIETLCTTDAAIDELEYHQALRAAGWGDRVRPTFRPDAVVNIDTPEWRENIKQLSALTRIDITSYQAYINALEERRRFFKSLGAVATDHGALTAHAERLSDRELADL